MLSAPHCAGSLRSGSGSNERKQDMAGNTTKAIADKGCEVAILASVFQTANVELLGRLETMDFHYPHTRLLYEELRLLVEAGEPLGVSVANALWFTSDSAKQRAAKAGEKNLSALAAEVFGEFVTSAHDGYYLKVLRRNRLRRSLKRLSVQLAERNCKEDREPVKTLEWLQVALDQIWEKASEVFPELVSAE